MFQCLTTLTVKNFLLYLRSTTCALLLQSSLNFEKQSEDFSWTDNHYEANCRRCNSSDGFDPNIGWPNGGHFGRKEKNDWHSQGRNGTENINHHGCPGFSSSTYTSTFHSGKGQGLCENNVSDNETGKKEDKEVPKQFESEDFPSLYPEYERTPNQNKSLAADVCNLRFKVSSWKQISQAEYPLNPKSRSPRMLVIKKGSTKELQISGIPVVGSIGNFSPFKSTAKVFTVSQNSAKECNWSNLSSPIDKVGQPRLTKLTRMQIDKKNEFLKILKQDTETRVGTHWELDRSSFNCLNSWDSFSTAEMMEGVRLSSNSWS
uniref:Vasculin n=1 Tax=Strigops habroptila TaxID=2489341 RepID=A0A672TJ08_STRHB